MTVTTEMREAAVLGCSQDLDDKAGSGVMLSFLFEDSGFLFFAEKRIESDETSEAGVEKISPLHSVHEAVEWKGLSDRGSSGYVRVKKSDAGLPLDLGRQDHTLRFYAPDDGRFQVDDDGQFFP